MEEELKDWLLLSILQEALLDTEHASRNQLARMSAASSASQPPPSPDPEIQRTLSDHEYAVNILKDRVRLLAERIAPVLRDRESPKQQGTTVNAPDWTASSAIGVHIKHLTYEVRAAEEFIERLLEDLAL